MRLHRLRAELYLGVAASGVVLVILTCALRSPRAEHDRVHPGAAGPDQYFKSSIGLPVTVQAHSTDRTACAGSWSAVMLVSRDAQCTVRITADYDELLELFRDDLERQSRKTLLNIETKAPGAAIRVPFLGISAVGNELTRNIGCIDAAKG